MNSRKDIETRLDIELLVNTFYDKVREDESIGFIFNEVAEVDWPKHLPVMYNFWESVLLSNPVYRGAPIPKHIALDKKVALHPAHFTRWKQLFFSTLDELFEGEKVAEARRRVNLMEPLMLHKIEQSRREGFIQ